MGDWPGWSSSAREVVESVAAGTGGNDQRRALIMLADKIVLDLSV